MFSRHGHRALLRVLCGLTLALVVGTSGTIVNPATVSAAPSVSDRGISWIDMGASLASLVPPAFWEVVGQPQTISPGADNVLNILLLGSDARSGGIARTDTIMVVSLKTIGGVRTVRAASIPRDTAKILNPFTAPASDTFTGRVNAILKKLKAQFGSTAVALQKFEQVIEYNLQIPIDYHALITFRGFHAMVDVVDPISVNISTQIKDTGYWDDPNKPKGVYFPAQSNYQLWTWQPDTRFAQSNLCNGLWKTRGTTNPDLWCRRAMPYVRSRKGSGNSDFRRARRQQEFVFATIKDVTSSQLPQLLNSATAQDSANQLYTSFPITAGNIADFFNRLQGARFGNHVVFQPKTYSTRITGTTAYRLKLDVVRSWANVNLQ